MSHHNIISDSDDAMMHWSVAPMFSRDCYTPWRALSKPSPYHDVLTNVTANKNQYQVCMDVHQFAPHEISVKTVGDLIIVEGKHEEKQDHHGYISRHFVRKYKLPKDHESEDVVSSLSSDGILSIIAPRKNPNALEGERIVPIHATGPVHKVVRRDPHHQHPKHHKVEKPHEHQIHVQHLH